jgi:hypothetical protein
MMNTGLKTSDPVNTLFINVGLNDVELLDTTKLSPISVFNAVRKRLL